MYRLLLRAFPESFRREFGAEMTTVFEERRRDARRLGVGPHIAFLLRTLIDVVRHGLAERRGPERKRGDSPLRSFVQDLRFALRLFRQRPAFSVTAVTTLALGIGVNVAVFSVVNGVLLRWLPLPQPEQIVKLAETTSAAGDAPQPSSWSSFAALRDGSADVFQSLAAYRLRTATLSGTSEDAKVQVAYTTGALFDVIGVAPVLGRPLTQTDVDASTDAAVVSHAFWRARLGADPNAIGRSVELNALPVRIVGVMPERVVLPENADVWRPLELIGEERTSLNHRSLSAIGRLKAGVSPEVANAAVARVAATLPTHGAPFGAYSATVLNLRELTVGAVRSDLLFVQVVAAIVFLIGCTNVANLMLVTASARQHELSIRAAIGAGHRRLMRQLLAESLALSVLGGVCGLAIAMWLVPVLVAAYPGELPGAERVSVGSTEAGVALLAALAATTLFGLAPALVGSRVHLSSVLRAGARTTSSRAATLTRWTLVSAEIALTLTVLAGGVLLIRSYAALTMQPIGFLASNVITAEISLPDRQYSSPSARHDAVAQIIDRLKQQAGAASVAATFPLSFDGFDMGFGFTRAAGDTGEQIFASGRYVTADYLDVFKTPLLQGRFITSRDTHDSAPVVVVTEKFAQTFAKDRDILGMPLGIGDGRYATVIGVVGDARTSYFQKVKPFVLLPISQGDVKTVKIAVRTNTSAAAFAPLMRESVRGFDPHLPMMAPTALADIIAKSTADRRFNMTLLVTLGALALVLAVVGVYGVMSYVVGQREREVGIRIALGAQPHIVQALMIRQGLSPILLGIAGGLVGGWYLASLLRKELFKVTAHDPSTFVVAAVGFLLVGVLACWIPSRRASRVNPIRVLRAD